MGVVASPEPAASSRGVETGAVGLAIVVDKMVVRAQKKFDQLDTDGNGALEGEELVGLARVGVVELPSRRRCTERGAEGR